MCVGCGDYFISFCFVYFVEVVIEVVVWVVLFDLVKKGGGVKEVV